MNDCCESDERLLRDITIPASGERDMTEPPRILVYNAMWGAEVNSADVFACDLTTDRALLLTADAIVFHIPSMARRFPAKRPHQRWVAWSLESDVNYPQLSDAAFMSRFDLTMTYRQDSDVPLSYLVFYQDGDGIEPALRMNPGEKRTDGLATMFLSSGLNKSGRIDYATELRQYVDIHSYGSVQRTHHLPKPDQGRSSKLNLLSQYKFDLSFENSRSVDYVTEKFFDPLVAGTVPVYLGAPNIADFAPGEHCFIDVRDFSGPRELADYLHYLDQNDAAYAEYFAWKERPFKQQFRDLVDREQENPFTRLCRAISASPRGAG